jgi:hypothetical protein
VDDRDVALRNATYGLFVELGRAPAAEEVAGRENRDAAAVREAWRRLHDAHALVLDHETGEIRMANPFSGVPTAHRVHANGRWWYANCAWDAFGICVALDADGRIETACPDCGDPIHLTVTEGGRPDDESLLFHCLVPAAHWWDDIVFT